MQQLFSTRTIGAIAVGCALVAGAHTISTFGAPATTQPATLAVAETTQRLPITVFDADQNGIEDWRDEFIETAPIVIEDTADVYTPPETLTGQLGVDVIEGYLRHKTYGDFGPTPDSIIEDSVNRLTEETNHTLFDTKDIIIMNDWPEETVVTYANALALSLMNASNNGVTDDELTILSDIVRQQNTDRIDELTILADSYATLRDDALAIPVPAIFQKEHLDLINTYHAVHTDIAAMANAIDDPVVSLMRIKRYEDDVIGMSYALANLYNALVPFAAAFSPDDPALRLVNFSPDVTL